MTTDAAIMADLNFGGIDKANPRATTKTMLGTLVASRHKQGRGRNVENYGSGFDGKRPGWSSFRFKSRFCHVYELYYRAKALSVLI